MSKYYRDHGEYYFPEYEEPGRTKQSFKDECDVNLILKRAQRKGGLAHVEKYPQEVYGEFNQDMDLLTAHSRIAKANEIFNELPSEVRSEFGNDALAFVQFAGAPENQGKLEELIPAIAEPGRYFPNTYKRGGQGAGAATAPAEGAPAPDTQPTGAGGSGSVSEPSEASDGGSST